MVDGMSSTTLPVTSTRIAKPVAMPADRVTIAAHSGMVRGPLRAVRVITEIG